MAEEKGRAREALRLAAGYGGAAAAIVLFLYLGQMFLATEETSLAGGEGEATATITNFSGSVEIRRAAGMSWLRAEVDMPLGEQDRVRTSDRSHSVIRFKGGTEIRIGPNSLIVVSESSLELGEGTVETESAGAASGFKLKTAGGTEIDLVKREIDVF